MFVLSCKVAEVEVACELPAYTTLVPNLHLLLRDRVDTNDEEGCGNSDSECEHDCGLSLSLSLRLSTLTTLNILIVVVLVVLVFVCMGDRLLLWLRDKGKPCRPRPTSC